MGEIPWSILISILHRWIQYLGCRSDRPLGSRNDLPSLGRSYLVVVPFVWYVMCLDSLNWALWVILLRESRHMTYHTTALLPNSCCPMADGPFRDPKGSVLSTPQILDPSMKDWYQYRPWNLTHGAQLRESRHMTYHTTALLPNSCGQWRMVQFGTPRVGPIHTPNIGPIDEGLISISTMEYHP